MNNTTFINIVHAVIIMALQFFVLRNFSFNVLGDYSFTILFYPLVIFLLPLQTPRSLVLVFSFMLGFVADIFYDSPGVHSASLVLTGFCRGFVLRILEPRRGYRTDNSPTIRQYGFNWFLTYSAILLAIHILTYFSIDVFTFVFIDKIVVNSLISFVVSYTVILLYQVFVRH